MSRAVPCSVQGRSEEGMGLRGGQNDDSSLDQGRCKVLTVLVLSHSPSPAGTESQATEEPGALTQRKMMGFSGGKDRGRE